MRIMQIQYIINLLLMADTLVKNISEQKLPDRINDSNKPLKILQKICKRLKKSEKYVYKKCVNILSKKDPYSRKWLVILKKTRGTKTNEERFDVVDKKYAKFRGDKFMVVAIINVNKPTMRRKSIVNEVYVYGANPNSIIKTRYRVGKIVSSHKYDIDLNKVCTSGIHYFKSLEAAYYYELKIKNGKVISYGDNGSIEYESIYENGKLDREI